MSELTSIPSHLATYLTREGRTKHLDNFLRFPTMPYHSEVTLKEIDEARRRSNKPRISDMLRDLSEI